MRSILAALLIIPLVASSAQAQTVPPRSLYQSMLDVGKASGWVAFRNFNGRQLLYFTHLQTLHCRLKEIRYSINSDALDQRVELVACNKAIPFSVSEKDVHEGRLYKSMPPGTAEWVAVQVVWEDGEESDVQRVRVCENVGDATCGVVE